MKKTVLKRLRIILLLVVFVLSLSYVYISHFYEEKLIEIDKNVYETLGKGFTLFKVTKNIDSDKQTKFPDHVGKSTLFISLKPGDEFEGRLGLKNHDTEMSHTYGIKEHSFKKMEPDENGTYHQVNDFDGVLPALEFEKLDLNVGPKEVRYLDYSITVPEGAEEGFYDITIAAYVTDDTAQKVVSQGVILDLAVAVKLKLEITDNPRDLKYVSLDNYSRGLAMTQVMVKIGYVVAVLLGAVTLFLLYFAFKYEKK